MNVERRLPIGRRDDRAGTGRRVPRVRHGRSGLGVRTAAGRRRAWPAQPIIIARTLFGLLLPAMVITPIVDGPGAVGVLHRRFACGLGWVGTCWRWPEFRWSRARPPPRPWARRAGRGSMSCSPPAAEQPVGGDHANPAAAARQARRKRLRHRIACHHLPRPAVRDRGASARLRSHRPRRGGRHARPARAQDLRARFSRTRTEIRTGEPRKPNSSRSRRSRNRR